MMKRQYLWAELFFSLISFKPRAFGWSQPPFPWGGECEGSQLKSFLKQGGEQTNKIKYKGPNILKMWKHWQKNELFRGKNEFFLVRV